MTRRDYVKISGTVLVLAFIGVLLFIGFKGREKPQPYDPRPTRSPLPERKVRTPKVKPKVTVHADTLSTNEAAEETISMKELRHERAVMFVPEGDPIPGFDTKGLVDDRPHLCTPSGPTSASPQPQDGTCIFRYL